MNNSRGNRVTGTREEDDEEEEEAEMKDRGRVGETETERQADRQTERERDRQREKLAVTDSVIKVLFLSFLYGGVSSLIRPTNVPFSD